MTISTRLPFFSGDCAYRYVKEQILFSTLGNCPILIQSRFFFFFFARNDIRGNYIFKEKSYLPKR